MSVTSIAALKTTAGTPGQSLSLEGYYAAADGGGGLFAWDAASTATPDDALVVQVTGVTTGRWRRLYSGPLNVRWFGAKGDTDNSGTGTDDTTAVQKAYDSLPYSQGFPVIRQQRIGGAIYFPPGRYKVTAPIRVKGTIRTFGDSMSSSIVTCTAGDGAFWLIPSSLVDVHSQTMWEDVGIHTTSGMGIFAKIDATYAPHQMLTAVRVRRVAFTTRSWAIYFAAPDAYCQDFLLEDVDVREPGAGAVWVDGNFNQLRNLAVTGGLGPNWDADRAASPATGVWTDPVVAHVVVRGNGNTVDTCHVETGPNGKCASYYYGPSQQSFGGTTSGNVVHKNSWSENTQDADGYAIIVDGTAQVDIDHLILVGKLHAINGSTVCVGDATWISDIADLIVVDATSHVCLGMQRTSQDGALQLHSPRVKVDRRFNVITGRLSMVRGSDASANLFPNPGWLRGTFGLGTDFKGATGSLSLADEPGIGRALVITVSGWTAPMGNMVVQLPAAAVPYGASGSAIPGFWRYRITYDAGMTAILLTAALTDVDEDRSSIGTHVVATGDVTQYADFFIQGNGVMKIYDVEAYASPNGEFVRQQPVEAVRAWPTGAVEFVADAIPTSGTHVAGSKVWFTGPTAGNSPGAVCVAGGTPGTWKDMPALAS